MKIHYSWQNANNTLDNERAVLPTIVWMSLKWYNNHRSTCRRVVIIGWWAWGLAIFFDTNKEYTDGK
jgi:uncharacterized protein (DUF486 family)